MKKKKIGYDQLVFGLLLKFGSIDVIDIGLLMNMIGINNFSSINESNIGKYIKKCDNNRIEFDKRSIRTIYDCEDEFYQVAEKSQGTYIKKYLENLDLSEFVLRKIKVLSTGCVVKDVLEETFGDVQMSSIDELYRKGFMEDNLQENVRYGDHLAVRITQRGKLYLFLIDNRNEVNLFISFLRTFGYTNSYINEFLLAQDLDRPCLEVLSMENFEVFCNSYDEHYCSKVNKNYSRIKNHSKNR